MITIGGVTSPGAASAYFAKDNYYTKAQGLGASEWFGAGAEALGLIDLDAVEAVDELNVDLTEVDNSQQNAQGSVQEFSSDVEIGDTGVYERSEGLPYVSPEQGETEIYADSGYDSPLNEEFELLTEEVDEDLEREQDKLRGVDAEDFKAILEGRLPDGGRVGYQDKDANWQHVPGKDMVFAPSKSVSIMALVGGDERLTAAFQDSVKATLAFAERNYASVQDNPRGGEKTAFATGNLAAALFTHDTSRNQDPLLHVHAVVANLTQDPRTDKWRALNKRALYRNVYSLSRIQRADFAKRVSALGYDIEFGKHGNFELNVVPQAVRDTFSSRRLEIIEKIDGRDESFKGRREATLATRADKVELPRRELTSDWRMRSREQGFDAQKHIPEARVISPSARLNTRKAVSEAIEHETYTQTTLTRGALVAAALSHRLCGDNIKTVEKHIDAALTRGELVLHNVNSSTGELSFTTEAQIAAERDIQTLFKDAAKSPALAKDRPALRESLAKVHLINGREVKLNATQNAAMHHVLTSPGGYIGLQGLAGTGKTTALGVAVATLKQTTALNPFKRNPKIIGMAPTIAASRELAEKTNGSEITVQSYIARHKHLVGNSRPVPKLSVQKYKGSVILHDESSMLSNQMQRDFMQINARLGVAKVVFVGDTGQHGSIKAGPAFKMLQDFGMKTAIMDNIMRQKNPQLLEAAKAFASHDVHNGLKIIKEHIHEGPSYIEAAAKIYVDSRLKGQDINLMVMDNRTRMAVNAEVRSRLIESGHLGQTEYRHSVLLPTYLTPVQAAYSENYGSRDKVEFSQDIHKSPIKAGQIWSVERVDHRANRLILKLGDERVNWELQKLERQPFEHLRSETLKLRVGESVRIKQDIKDHDIRREDVGNLVSIDKDKLGIKLTDNRILEIPREHKSAQRLDHNYAVTTYGVQGRTVEHAIGVIDPASRATHKQAMSVMGTRSEHSLMIFTSNVEQMKARLRSPDQGDRIASHAIGETARERLEPQKEKIERAREIVREQSKARSRSRGIGR